jgi:ACS family hexuronate transporter-like MFS transporter
MNPSPLPPPPPVSPWRWWVCLLLMLATVINYMDRMALNQLGVRIQSSLGIDDEQYSWLEGAFSAAFAVGAVCTGFVVDRAGVRWVYPFMVLGWSAAGVLTGFSSGFWMLFMCRFMLGLFESGNWPCGIRTTKAVLRPDERSLGNSLFQSGTAFGAVITPLVVLAILRWADPGEPHRHAVMAVTGGTYEAVAGAAADTWKIPFRLIGSLGLVWIALWFITIPGRLVNTTAAADGGGPPVRTSFRPVFRDRRYWVLAALVIAINITWHGYRTWLPLYLQRQRGYTLAEMSWFTTVYYLVADVGSWTVGFFTLWLSRSRGLGVHASRTIAFAGCAGLTLVSLAVPFLPSGWPLQAGLLAVAFGALGLFPTYFALSQEVSSEHQGKVTGTLGFAAHGALALVYPIEGRIVKLSGTYEWVLGGIGVAPLVGLLLLLWFWKAPNDRV